MAPFVCVLHLLSMASSPPSPPSAAETTQRDCLFRRTFRFVPYGESAPTPTGDVDYDCPLTTISCDGRVPGSTLELTHWTDNETPESLYADTSTEIALNFARAVSSNGDGCYGGRNMDDAVVCNNHYDSDGVLSAFTCLHPNEALKCADLLVAGAEAGDFGEWSTDEGVKLDCALTAIGDRSGNDEERAYAVAFEALPGLLDDLDANEDLWREGWEDAVRGWKAIEEGSVQIETRGNDVAVAAGEGALSLSPYALNRGLREAGLAGDQPGAVSRVLRAHPAGEGVWSYACEKPGYGWVNRLVRRRPVPQAEGAKIAGGLNSRFGVDGGRDDQGRWKVSGGGLIGICSTVGCIDTPPDDVAQMLVELDKGVSRTD